MSIDNFNDDELTEIKAPAATPVQPKTVMQNVPEPSAPLRTGEDIDWGSDEADEIAKAAEGLPSVKIGKKEAARFAFVPGQALKHAKTHYREGFGSYRCLSKDGVTQTCCKTDGEPKDRFVAMVFRYTNADASTG